MSLCVFEKTPDGARCVICGRNYDRPGELSAIRRNCKSRGLGDTVARVTTTAGVKPCIPCKRIQETLNKLVPYS